MTDPNLDELEQRAKRHRVHGSCQIGTPDLLYLLYSARERDALKADNERLRAGLIYAVALLEDCSATHAIPTAQGVAKARAALEQKP